MKDKLKPARVVIKVEKKNSNSKAAKKPIKIKIDGGSLD